MKTNLLFVFFLSFVSWQLMPQELLPFVENFGKSDYRGDNEVSKVIQGQDLAMYFANNSYLLRYDGVCWERYSLPNKTAIKSILAVGDRIYSGSYREFGYWFRKQSKMHYVSLSNGKAFLEDEISNIVNVGSTVYFQSANSLFIYDGKLIRKLPFSISSCFVVGQQLWIITPTNGIYRYINKRLVEVEGVSLLKNSKIVSIEQYGNKIYFLTADSGIYVFEDKQLKRWGSPILNSTVGRFCAPNSLIVGTLDNGAYIFDLRSGTHIHLNRSNALNNNAVLSISKDKDNAIWLGLQNGIAHIEAGSPVNIFNDNSGALGSVFSINPMGKGYLLSSNRGVFELQDKKIALIPGTQGQAGDIATDNNQFLLGHDKGTYFYKKGQLSLLNNAESGLNLFKSSINAGYMQASEKGIVFYDNLDDFQQHKLIRGISEPIGYLAQNRKNEIWAAGLYRGLYCIHYDDAYRTLKVVNITATSKIANDFKVKMVEFRKEMLFLINNTWYTYNFITNKLEENALFNTYFKNVSELLSLDENRLLYREHGLLYFAIAKGSGFLKYAIPEKYYKGRLVNEHLKGSKIAGKYFVNLDDGFMALDQAIFANKLAKVKIEAFVNNNLVENTSEIKRKSNLRLHIISGTYGINEPNLFFNINDSKELFAVKDNRIFMSNLDSGSYKVGVFGYNGATYQKLAAFEFEVANAWYLSLWMMLFYLLLIGFVLYVYYKWNKMRIIQKLKLQKEELRHQQKIVEMELKAENELKSQEYEKHILQLELHSKSLEVASKSLSIAKHSEMIENIQNILDQEIDHNKIKSEIRKAIKINAANKHQWEVFESNLSMVNNDFIVALSKKYPHLTSKDIKLCVYLKMNLSSKEIAPMMNISFRGVELHRYRLRKKLMISSTESLSMFLLSL